MATAAATAPAVSSSSFAMRLRVLGSTADLEAETALVDAFFTEYESEDNFPDENEREDPEVIKGRIRGQDASDRSNVFTHLVALELQPQPAGGWEFGGGMVVEYYPISQCVLLTYLFVAKRFRGKLSVVGSPLGRPGRCGVAELLLHHGEGMAAVVARLTGLFGRVSAVLFESNHPSRTSPEEDSMPPHKRLGFFRRMGAMRVPIDYVQPPLEEGKSAVTNLLLNCFPMFGETAKKAGSDKDGGPPTVDMRDIMRFLMELTKSLDENMEPPVYQGEVFDKDIARTEALAGSAAEQEGVRFTGVTVDGVNLVQMQYQSMLPRRVTPGGVQVELVHIPLGEEPALSFVQAELESLWVIDRALHTRVGAGAAGKASSHSVWLALPDEFTYPDKAGAEEVQCVLEPATVPGPSVGLARAGHVQLLPAVVEAEPVGGGAGCPEADAHPREVVWRVTLRPARSMTECDLLKVVRLLRGYGGPASGVQQLPILFAAGPANTDPPKGGWLPLGQLLFGAEDGLADQYGPAGAWAGGPVSAAANICQAHLLLGVGPHAGVMRNDKHECHKPARPAEGGAALLAKWLQLGSGGADDGAFYAALFGLATGRLDFANAAWPDAVACLAAAQPLATGGLCLLPTAGSCGGSGGVEEVHSGIPFAVFVGPALHPLQAAARKGVVHGALVHHFKRIGAQAQAQAVRIALQRAGSADSSA